ncbi:MAG TPA: acyl-CoA dehydrogenase family protein [Myxococcaceae bacterium]|nr:acyl-CoA dehydrogenase family protein [Myxococcaceae bacterium]
MDFRLSEEQLALARGVRAFLERSLPIDRLPKLAASPALDKVLWRELAQLGAFNLRLPEDAGGAALGMVDAALVFAELGRSLFPGPAIWSNVLAGRVAGAGSGEAVVGGVDLTHGDPHPLLLEFAKDLDALVALRPEGLYRIETSSLDLQPIAVPFDPLTPVGQVLRLPKGERIGGPEEAERTRLEALTLASAFLLGISEATLELALSYAKTREQFGRPIGSFQAIKHLLSDMFVRKEVARAAVYTAGAVLDDPSAPAAVTSVLGARLTAGEAAMKNARACIQIHGSMGYTWDIPAHYFLKRTWVLDVAFGSSEAHAHRIASSL